MITPCAYTKSVNGKEMQVKIKIKLKQRLQICKRNNNSNDGVLTMATLEEHISDTFIFT